MNNNTSDVRRTWPKVLQCLCIAAICLFTAIDICFAEKNAYQAELNRLLLSAVHKDPELFGSNALCERDEAFWRAAKESSLLAVLERQEGFREIALDADHSVWFVPISACFGGNKAAFIMFVRVAAEFRSIETPIGGVIENVRLEGGKIVFNVTSNGGAFEEYRYLYSYDGKRLTEKLLERVQR